MAQGLINGLPTMITYIPGIVTDIAGIVNDNAPKLLEAGVKLIGMLGMGLIQAVPALLANLPQILMAVASVITAFNWLELGGNIIKFLGNGIRNMGGTLSSCIKNCFDQGLAYIKSLPGKAAGWAADMINGFVGGIFSSMHKVADAVKNVASTITAYMHFSRRTSARCVCMSSGCLTLWPGFPAALPTTCGWSRMRRRGFRARRPSRCR